VNPFAESFSGYPSEKRQYPNMSKTTATSAIRKILEPAAPKFGIAGIELPKSIPPRVLFAIAASVATP
jgi:hypothetical protein